MEGVGTLHQSSVTAEVRALYTHKHGQHKTKTAPQHGDCDPLYFYTDYGWLALGLMAHYQHSPPGAR